MKQASKILSVLLVLCMMLSVMGCTQPDDSETGDRNESQTEDGGKTDPTENHEAEPKQTYYMETRETFECVVYEEGDISIFETEYDAQGNLSRYVRGGREYTFVYGEDGMLQQAIATDPDGWMKTVDYTWDENGNLAEVVYRYEDGDERYRFEYEYTADGQLLKETDYEYGELSYWTTYTYTDTGYAIEGYQEDGTLHRWGEYILDEHGFIVESTIYYAAGDSYTDSTTMEYIYNDAGIMVSATMSNSYGFYHEMTFDEHGNPSSAVAYDDGEWYSNTSYEYTAVELTEAQYRALQQIIETFGHY